MTETLTTKPIQHKKLGIAAVLHDFSQKQFEEYQNFLVDGDAKSIAVKNGIVVRAAIKAEILTDTNFKVEDLPNMKPAALVWLSSQIHTWVILVTVPPLDDPNS